LSHTAFATKLKVFIGKNNRQVNRKNVKPPRAGLEGERVMKIYEFVALTKHSICVAAKTEESARKEIDALDDSWMRGDYVGVVDVDLLDVRAIKDCDVDDYAHIVASEKRQTATSHKCGGCPLKELAEMIADYGCALTGEDARNMVDESKQAIISYGTIIAESTTGERKPDDNQP
jgi:hypothetical protein